MWFLPQIGAAVAVISLLLKGPFLPGIVLMLAYVAARFATEVVTCTIELGERFRRRGNSLTSESATFSQSE
jgi:hypothetical protein